MAQVLKNFEFGRGRVARMLVAVEKYADGKAYKLTKGTDFDCEVEDVRQAVRKWNKAAPNRESFTSIRDCGPNEVIVQMVQKGAEKSKRQQKREKRAAQAENAPAPISEPVAAVA